MGCETAHRTTLPSILRRQHLPGRLRKQKCPKTCADDAPDCACALAEIAADEIERLQAALTEADTLLRFAVGKARTHNQAALIDKGRRQMMARARMEAENGEHS
jgi:hypothetical protein